MIEDKEFINKIITNNDIPDCFDVLNNDKRLFEIFYKFSEGWISDLSS